MVKDTINERKGSFMDLLTVTVGNNGIIEGNFETLEQQIKVLADFYKGVIVDEDNIKESKKDLADLRKEITAIENVRKDFKKQWMEPYTKFENKCKHLVELLNEPINAIDGQLKEFETKRLAEKRSVVEKIYSEEVDEYADFIPLDSIFQDSWLNVSTKEKDIRYDINEAKMRIVSELNIIKGLGSEIEDEVIAIYKKNGNSLAAAIERNTQYQKDKATIEAKKPEEKKPDAKAMGQLNNIVEKFRTVHFIVSKEDEEEVENLLSLSDISFQKVDG